MVDDIKVPEYNFFQRVRAKWDLLKLEATLKIMEKDHFKARKEHCRIGCHKIITQKVGWKHGNKPWVYVRFLKCIHCNYLFFARTIDRDNYMKYQGKDKDSFSAFLKVLSNLKTEHHNKVGGTKREDVSSRCLGTSKLSFETLALFGTYLNGWDDVGEMNYWARKLKFQKITKIFTLKEVKLQ